MAHRSTALLHCPERENPCSGSPALLTSRAVLEGQRGLVHMRKNLWRAIIEVLFIMFLFYSNLLMGEFERSAPGQRRGLAWALTDVLTSTNFAIALIAALIGYIVFEFLRNRY